MLIKKWNILYGYGSNKEIKVWQILVREHYTDGIIQIVKSYGQLDGKMQENIKEIKSGKNIGKKNETSIVEQAILEAESNWLNKKEKKMYCESIEELEERGKEFSIADIRPMLAQKFTEKKHKIVYPALAQPKLNGVRCITCREGDKITYVSREGMLFETLHHLDDILLSIMKEGEVFDGEIYNSEIFFEDIVSAVKKDGVNTKKLQYWVYDMVDLKKSCIDRIIYSIEAITFRNDNNNLVIPLDFIEVNSEEEIYRYHNSFVSMGFEGIIIRNMESKYKLQYRSPDLQKYKEFIDEEYIIVGGREGLGSYSGCIIFETKHPTKEIFVDVVPKGSMESKRQMFNELTNLIGKRITIRYQQLSEKNVPIFPVGIAIRDYE